MITLSRVRLSTRKVGFAFWNKIDFDFSESSNPRDPIISDPS